MARSAFLWACVVWLTACAKESPARQAPACASGTSRLCPCLDGAQGSQLCLSGGSGFGSCVCPEPAAPATVCTPGQSASCPCPDGTQGSHSCNADGAGHGACACSITSGLEEPATGSPDAGTAQAGMGAPEVEFPPCPAGYECRALPAAPDTPVCLDPQSPAGFALPPPCMQVSDCEGYGLSPVFSQCLETASSGFDFGTLCFTGCTP